MTTQPVQPAQPRLASAVMLLRDQPGGEGIEVFMVRRVIQSDFMPDVYVFPGGSVSKDDAETELSEGTCMPVAPSAADPEGRTALGKGLRAAAIRELFEEAGILLANHSDTSTMLALTDEQIARFGEYRRAFHNRTGSLIELAHAEKLRYATDRLGYFAHWITPQGMPRRFDTHFFITTAPQEQQAAHDRIETSEGIWIAPSEALARYEREDFPIVFATIHQLRDLAAFHSVKEALEYTATHHVPVRQPVLVREGETARVYLPEDSDDTWEVPEHMHKS